MTDKTKKPKRVTIPKSCKSLDAVYDILVRELSLPAHFGRNLDALYDCLTGDVPGPFTITVADAKVLEKALGPKGKALLGLLRDAAKARKDLRLNIRQ